MGSIYSESGIQPKFYKRNIYICIYEEYVALLSHNFSNFLTCLCDKAVSGASWHSFPLGLALKQVRHQTTIPHIVPKSKQSSFCIYFNSYLFPPISLRTCPFCLSFFHCHCFLNGVTPIPLLKMIAKLSVAKPSTAKFEPRIMEL